MTLLDMTLLDLRSWHQLNYYSEARLAKEQDNQVQHAQSAELHQQAVNCLDKEIRIAQLQQQAVYSLDKNIRRQHDTGLQTVPSDSVAIGGGNSFFSQCSNVAELVSKYASHLEQSSQDVPAVQRAAFARELSAVLFRSVELALRYGSKS